MIIRINNFVLHNRFLVYCIVLQWSELMVQWTRLVCLLDYHLCVRSQSVEAQEVVGAVSRGDSGDLGWAIKRVWNEHCI